MNEYNKDHNKLKFHTDNLVKAINENKEENIKLHSKRDTVNQLTKDYISHARITPLFLASKLGRTNAVKILLGKGANVNAVDELGRTALQAACEENYEDVVDILLSSDADPNTGGVDGLRTPSTTCLGGSIKSRNTSVLQKLLDAGAHVNFSEEPNQELDWPSQRVASSGNYLHSALREPCPDILELLCRHGCDSNARDDNEETPLFLAVRKLDVNSSRILLEYGANPNIVTDQGNTLNIAAATVPINKEMIQLLVENGAELNIRERMNRVPLALYLSNFNMNKDVSIVKYLIKHGTILNEPGVITEINWMLTRMGQFKVVKMAIEGGIDIHRLPWLRNFVESPPGRKYWYTSTDYNTEEEMTFRKYAKPIITTPHCLSKLCCFNSRNQLITIGSGRSIAKCIEELPLPELIKQYLFLEHL